MNINNETFSKAYKCLYEANILLENGLGDFSELQSLGLSLINKVGQKNTDRLNFMGEECLSLNTRMYNTIQGLAKMNEEASTYFNDILSGGFEDEFGNYLSPEYTGNLKPKNNSDIAHRGYGAEENTAEAFRNAGKEGFWGCEADIRFDQDGNVVCSHDTVDGNENPTTFEEYLDICKEYGMTAIIDLKYEDGNDEKASALSPAVLKIIEEKGMTDSCILQTNVAKDVSNIRANSSDARIWYLSNEVSDKTVQLMEDNSVECLNLKLNQYSTEQIKRLDRLSESDIDVCVWNVQTQETKDRLLKKGATYVMSDNSLDVTAYQEGEEDFNAVKGNYKSTTLVNYGNYDEDAVLLPEIDPNSGSDLEVPNVLLAETGDKAEDGTWKYDGKIFCANPENEEDNGRMRYTRTDGVVIEESYCADNLENSIELKAFKRYDGDKVVEGVKISDMDYWVREDGVQMIGDYVAVATTVIPRSTYGVDDNMDDSANWSGANYNYGDVVETTLGKGIVMGRCGEAYNILNNENVQNYEVYTLWNSPGYSGKVRADDYVPTNYAHDPKLEHDGVAVIKPTPTYEAGK